MSDMKCPFCNCELERVYSRPFQLICAKCGSLGTDKLWQELIRTRKALEIAVDALNRIDKQLMTGIKMTSQANKALEQITALEQKD